MKHKTGKILAGIAVAAAAIAFALTTSAVTENTEWWDVPPTNTLAQVRTAAGFAKNSDLTTHTGNSTIHITATERTNWNSAYTKSQTAYVPSGGGFHDVGAGFTLVIPATNSVPGQSQSSHYYGGIRTKNGDDYTSYAHDGIAYHRNGVTYDFFWDLTDPYGIVRRTELSGYKPVQTAKSSPAASGNDYQFIATVSQDVNGAITATKKTVRSASTSQSGIVQLNDTYTSSSTSYAPTANALKNGVNNAKSYADSLTNALHGIMVGLLAGKLGNTGTQTILFPALGDDYYIEFASEAGGTFMDVYDKMSGSSTRYGYGSIVNGSAHLTLPGKDGTLALTSETTLTPAYSDWVCDPASYTSGGGVTVPVAVEWNATTKKWEPHIGPSTGTGKGDAASTSLSWTAGSEAMIAITATRTIIGYTLGSQSDKPLQPAGDYAPATKTVTVTATETMLPPECFPIRYTDGGATVELSADEVEFTPQFVLRIKGTSPVVALATFALPSGGQTIADYSQHPDITFGGRAPTAGVWPAYLREGETHSTTYPVAYGNDIAPAVSNIVTTALVRERLGVYLYIGQDGGIYVHTPDEQ